MKKNSIHIDQCGFLTSIQDAGRTGFLQYGISKGGVMDAYAMKAANILVGNDEHCTVLEITQSPHRFHFLNAALIAFTGGGLQPAMNQMSLALYQPLFIPAGNTIELKQQIPGYRMYMSVAGGFAADEFLNSHSTDFLVKAGGHYGRPLKKDDVLQTKEALTAVQKNLATILNNSKDFKIKYSPDSSTSNIIRVLHSIEWNYLTDEAKQSIISSSFSVTSKSSRMGYRLKGEALPTVQPCDIISSPVTQGTVQLTSSGELIVLMADAQTIGGYPRILQVIAADLHIIAQKKPGDAIQFQVVSLQDAEELYQQQIIQLNNLKKVIYSAG